MTPAQTRLAVTSLIGKLMEKHGVTRRELARRMGCAPSCVTQSLGIHGNMQLGTLAKILAALGYELEPRVRPLVGHPSQPFQDRLASARHEAGMSIRKLASAAGLSPSVISSYETGRTDPARGVVERLAKALGVDASWLAYGASPS